MKRFLAIVMMAALFPSTGMACAGTVPLLKVEELMDQASVAYAEGNHDLFKVKAHDIADKVECLQHLITDQKAVRLHAYMGLLARVEKDVTRTRLAFTAARSLDPKFELKTIQVPEADPANVDFGKSFKVKYETEKLPKPMSGKLRFDGKEGLERPINVPTIFQRLDSTGKPRKTVYLWPGMPVPEYNTKKKKNSNKIIY